MADAAVLQVEADIVIADNVPLDVDLAELGVGGSLGPGHGGVHVAHGQEIVIKNGGPGSQLRSADGKQ